jgi:hypothetical protein
MHPESQQSIEATSKHAGLPQVRKCCTMLASNWDHCEPKQGIVETHVDDIGFVLAHLSRAGLMSRLYYTHSSIIREIH